MDHKMAAAGDNESQPMRDENESSGKTTRKSGVGLDYAKQVLDYLMSMCQVHLQPDDQERWIKRLSTAPPWKFLRLAEFNSPYIAEVWKFFDGLRQQGEAYQVPALPEPKSNIAKDTFVYVKKLMDDSLSSAEKDALEKSHILAMRKKYPHLKWMCGRSANKGE